MNADMPEWQDVDWMVAVATQYLGSGRSGLRQLEVEELLATMDGHGVKRAVLDFDVDNPSEHTEAVRSSVCEAAVAGWCG